MNKKGSVLLLLVLLIGLPGCGHSKKERSSNGRKMAQAGFDNGMSVADAALTNEDFAGFFEGMDQFAALSDDDLESVADALAWDNSTLTDDLDPVYFGFAETKIDQGQEEKLAYDTERAKQLLEDARAEDANAKLVIEGHACASAGTPERNLDISRRRAEVVRDHLVNAGIDPDALRVIGRGSDMLVVEEGDSEQQWPNRRVELHLLRA